MPLARDGRCPLGQALEDLDYRVVEYSLGCIVKSPLIRRPGRFGGRLPRHLKIAQLPDWLQRVHMQLRSLERRLIARAGRTGDHLAGLDVRSLQDFCVSNHSPPNMSHRDLVQEWERLCRGRRRTIPVPKKGLLPILSERDRQIRDAGIKWYCGSFPGRPDALKVALGIERYTEHKSRIAACMGLETWPAGVRARAAESISTLVHAIEGCARTVCGKRGRSPPGAGLSRRKRSKTT